MKYPFLFLSWLSLFSPACSREFPAPAPIPVIEEIAPSAAYQGEAVTLQGTNFASQPEDNLVVFGTENAKVLSVRAGQLIVEVPELEPDEKVFVTVSTSAGQGTSTSEFTCRGPGHPREQAIDHVVRIPAGPLAVTSGRFQAGIPPAVLATGAWSQTLSAVNIVNRNHYGVGVNGTPFSIARARDAGGTYHAYVASLRNSQGPGQPTRLGSFPIDDDEDTHLLFAPPSPVSLPAIGGEPFLPARVFSYRQEYGSEIQRVAVTDLYRPAVAVIEPGTNTLLKLAWVEGQECVVDLEESRPFGDLVRYSPTNGSLQDSRLIASMLDRPEIWSVPDDPGIDPACCFPLWPPTDGTPFPPEEWDRRFTDLALCQDGTRLYAADANSLVVIEFTVTGLGPGIVLTAGRTAPLFGQPFSMVCAQPADDNGIEQAERLYVATEAGIQVLGLSDDGVGNAELELMEFIDLDPSAGEIQSLGLLRNQNEQGNNGDVVVLADLVRDRLAFFPSGNEAGGAWQIPMGSPVPQIAPSRFEDQLYLADPYTNMLRLVDQNTGLYTTQFPVLEIDSFGAADVSTAWLDDKSEVLMIPVPLPAAGGELSCDGFGSLVVRLARDEETFDEWRSEWQLNGWDAVSENMDHADSHGCFQELLPAPGHGAVFLVRYGENPAIWSMGLDAEAVTVDGMMDVDYGMKFHHEMEEEIRLARLSPDESRFALLTSAASDNPRVDLVEVHNTDTVQSIGLDQYTTLFATDMAVRLAEDGTPSIYLALPSLGQLVAMTPQSSQPHVILTAGEPSHLFLSPDGKRLYATHVQGSQVSIVDVGCSPQASCERVLVNLEVEPNPAEVVFHPSGKEAYITHLWSNAITVID